MNRSHGLTGAAAAVALIVATAACGGDDEPATADAVTTAITADTDATDDVAAASTTVATTTAGTEPAVESTSAPTTAPPTTAPPTTEPDPACPEPTPNEATQPAGIVAALDPAAGEFAEGVAVDRSGNVFVTLVDQGRLLKLAPGASEYEDFGVVPGFEWAGIFGLLGLAVDDAGNVYGAVHAGAATGVWRFDCRTGAATRLAGTEDIAIPNALTFDDLGNLYVTDFWSNGDEAAPLGAIWRIGPDGTVEKWLEDEALGGTGAFGLGTPAGVNGVAFGDGTVYAAVTERMSLVAIPVLDDGSPGEVSTIVDGGIIPDGIALGADGRVYVADVGGSAIRRVGLDGSIETLAEGAAAGLDLPASIAFGIGGTELTLYATNLANIEAFSTGVGPALVAIDVDTPGFVPSG